MGEREQSKDAGVGERRRVGLGHVVEDHLSTGSPDPDDPKVRDPRLDPGSGTKGEVEDESADSFPASDPPSYMSHPSTPRDRQGA